MLSFLKKIYHEKKLNKFRFIRFVVKFISFFKVKVLNLQGFINLIKLKFLKKSKNEKINLVLLYQMPELWDKFELVYNELIKNKRINLIILAIPKFDITSNDQVFLNNEALSASDKLNCTVINSQISTNEWCNLKDLDPDYVFYQRPYDQYLPECYRSNNVIKFCKTCYIPYCYALSKEIEGTVYHRSFFYNLYLFYAENDIAKQILTQRNPFTHILKLKYTKILGCPSLEHANMVFSSSSVSDQFRIVWTPRWTTIQKLGGTNNFFDYKDKFFELIKNNENITLVFRPHPLAFDNYLQRGLMTQNEIDTYKGNETIYHNFAIDKNKTFLNTFMHSDVLITDISSVIVEYFLTGKPIIYCDKSTKLNLFAQKMSEGFYWANNWDQVENYIKILASGKDKLYDKRQEIIKYLYKNSENSSKKIVDSLITDFDK